MSSTTNSSTPTPTSISTLIHNRNFWYIAGSIILVLIIVGGYLYYQSAQQKSKSAAAAKSALQTATVRQGSIVISASGTGQVVAAATANLGFPNTGSSSNSGNGTLTQLNVIVGNQVKVGELLAQEDNTNQAQALAQAKFNLAQLTSPAAIATAQGAVATDEVNVTNALQLLEFDISPTVYHWEQEIAADQQNLTNAQLDAQANPSTAATQKVQDAQNTLNYDNQELAAAQIYYTKYYAPEYFTYTSKTTGFRGITPPSDTDIASARAALALAQAQEVQDQDLVTALTTGVIPDTATGPSLTALKQAQTALQTAQTDFNDTQIISPINGTVTAVNNQIGDTVGSATVITVSDLSRLLLTIYIDESDLSKLAIGEEADAVFNSLPNQTFKGKVTEIVPALTTVDNVPAVQAQVQLDNTTGTALYVGLNATVNVINAQANNVLLVPIQALKLLEPGKYAVFVVQNGNLTLQPVVVGLMDQSFAEIKSGLQSGDVVSTGLAATNQSAAAVTLKDNEMDSEKIIIELKDLSKVYQMGEEISVKALDNINLEIHEGEFVSIMGPSGSGKTTLMSILGCLDHPTSGQYFLDGEDVSHLNKVQTALIRNNKIGFVFQSYNLLARMTALHNVILPMIYSRFKKTSWAQREKRGRETLEMVGLGKRIHHLPRELSGGQQQRVAIARALVNDPVLILADEPTGNLDTHSGDEIMDLLHSLHQRGRTIVMVTHNPETAVHADQVIHVHDGVIAKDETDHNGVLSVIP